MNSPCTMTVYAKDKDGYGQLGYNGRSEKHHRVIYAITNNLTMDDIRGKVVMHTCDNPSCVNPAHLTLGSVLENNRDAWAKGRRTPPKLKGEAHGKAIVTEEIVRAIRIRFIKEEAKVLAKDYGLKVDAIYAIASRRNWKHVI